MSDETVLRANKIKKSFDGREILGEVSLDIKKGEFVALLGVSGGGKTTLFNCLSGLMKPDFGNVYYNGEEITGMPGKISYMLQKDLLLPHKKIIENVTLPLILRGMKKKEAEKKAEVFFELFGLEGCEKLYPSQLSGGMRQRAAFLRTYLAGYGKKFKDKEDTAAIMLLDEPFSALDAITKSGLHEWFIEVFKKMGFTIVFVTHDVDEAVALSDRVLILGYESGTAEKGGTTIIDEIKIDAMKENIEEFKLSEKFLKYKKEVLNRLKV